MLFVGSFLIYFIFTESVAEVKSESLSKTLDSYISYVDHNQPEDLKETLNPNPVISVTTESYFQKKKRLIYKIFKNAILQQREQREKDEKAILHHHSKRSADIEKLENETKELFKEIEELGVDKTIQNASIIELYRAIEKLESENITQTTAKMFTVIKKSAEEITQTASPIQLSRKTAKMENKKITKYATTIIELYRQTEKLGFEETTQNASPIQRARDIEKFEVEKITQNATELQLSRETEKLRVDETAQNATSIKLAREIDKHEVEETTQNATAIQLSRDMEKLENEKTTQNATKMQISKEPEKLGVEETTQEVNKIELSKRMYEPIRIGKSKNNATKLKSSTKHSLRQLKSQPETEQDKSKKAWDDVIRLRSANVSTTRKKSTLKIGKPYETMKEMISYKRRSSIERRSQQQHS